MSQQEILDILAKINAVITRSHVVYTSGKHGSAYVNKDAIYPHTQLTSELCYEFADEFYADKVDVVIAPAIGGVILSQWTAYHLTIAQDREVPGVYAEKVEGGDAFVIKRGYDKLIVGKRVLVVEDILTTGGSVKKVIEAVRAIGGNVIGVGALCNRGGVTAQDLGDVPKLVSLLDIKLDAWDAENCPLCAKSIPINTDVGKGREFLAKMAAAL